MFAWKCTFLVTIGYKWIIELHSKNISTLTYYLLDLFVLTVLILKFLKEEEDSGGRQITFLVGILEDLTWPFMVLVFEVWVITTYTLRILWLEVVMQYRTEKLRVSKKLCIGCSNTNKSLKSVLKSPQYFVI